MKKRDMEALGRALHSANPDGKDDTVTGLALAIEQYLAEDAAERGWRFDRDGFLTLCGFDMSPEGSLTAKPVSALEDGDRFSKDGGTTWHVFAVHGFGTVSVYASDRRDDDAPTVRVPVTDEEIVLVRA